MGRLLRGLLREPLLFPAQQSLMDRVAVFVDAGYVFAQGSVLLAGKKLTRSEVILDHEAAVVALAEFASKVSGVPILRLYWYDGTSTGPTAQHLTLAHLNDVKVRLGFVNSVGEQKGVDSLIVTDMIALARNRAMSDAVLVSGDEDIRVGVQQAQEFGVRVHLVGIKPSRGSQSLFLLQEADRTYEWSDAEVSRFLSCKPKIIAPVGSIAVPTAVMLSTGANAGAVDPLEAVASKVAAALHAGGRAAIGQDLVASEKKQVRAVFLFRCRLRLGHDPA